MAASPCRHEVYHCVFHTYRRKVVFVEDVFQKADALIREIAYSKGYQLMTYAVRPDHVHLLLALLPQEVPGAMNMFKGIMSRRIFQQFPELRMDMHSDHLWAAGYFARTVDLASLAATTRYIENQHHPVHEL